MFNVFSEKNIRFKLSSKKKTSIISLSSDNSKTDNFSIILSNNQNDTTKTIQLVNGFASTILDTSNDIVYQIQISSRHRSGINILSDSRMLNLIVNDQIVLIGQKATRTFWLNLTENDTVLVLDLNSSESVSIKLIDSNGTLIKKCESAKCKLTLDTKKDDIKNPIRLEIQNDSDATLNINGGPPLLSTFKNQL